MSPQLPGSPIGGSSSDCDFKPGWKNPSLYADEGRGTVSIIAAVKQAGIKRVLWVGGADGLESSAWATISSWVDAAGHSAISIQDYAVATIDELERPRRMSGSASP